MHGSGSVKIPTSRAKSAREMRHRRFTFFVGAGAWVLRAAFARNAKERGAHCGGHAADRYNWSAGQPRAAIPTTARKTKAPGYAPDKSEMSAFGGWDPASSRCSG